MIDLQDDVPISEDEKAYLRAYRHGKHVQNIENKILLRELDQLLDEARLDIPDGMAMRRVTTARWKIRDKLNEN